MRPGKARPTSRLGRFRAALGTRNVAQAVVTISVGVAFAVATYLAGQATDHWNRAVKDDVKWSAGLIEDARYLFADEAPFAYEYATTVARADALTESAAGLPPREATAALIEARATSSGVQGRRDQFLLAGDTLLDDRYWTGDHFDVATRLEDARASARTTVVADPAALEATGDRYAAAAVTVALVPIVVAGGYLVLAAWRRRRAGPTPRRHAADADGDVALIPDPVDPSRAGIATLAFLAWVLLVVLPPLQIQQSLRTDQANAESSAGAVAVMRSVIVSNLAAGFATAIQQEAEVLRTRAEARALAYSRLPPESVPGQLAILRAEARMILRYGEIAEATTQTLNTDTTLDDTTRDAIRADPEDWQPVLAEQNAATARAEQSDQRDNALTLALVLAGIATTLAALAAVDRRSRSVPVLTAVALAAAGGATLLGLTL